VRCFLAGCDIEVVDFFWQDLRVRFEIWKIIKTQNSGTEKVFLKKGR